MNTAITIQIAIDPTETTMMKRNRFYTFSGVAVDGTKHKMEVPAPNMERAVAYFVTLADRPVVVRWFVRCGRVVSGRLNRTHPVTRERFGHVFDGVSS